MQRTPVSSFKSSTDTGSHNLYLTESFSAPRFLLSVKLQTAFVTCVSKTFNVIPPYLLWTKNYRIPAGGHKPQKYLT